MRTYSPRNVREEIETIFRAIKKNTRSLEHTIWADQAGGFEVSVRIGFNKRVYVSIDGDDTISYEELCVILKLLCMEAEIDVT